MSLSIVKLGSLPTATGRAFSPSVGSVVARLRKIQRQTAVIAAVRAAHIGGEGQSFRLFRRDFKRGQLGDLRVGRLIVALLIERQHARVGDDGLAEAAFGGVAVVLGLLHDKAMCHDNVNMVAGGK